eukprot:14750209-Alexandrium_andersonii.AAC.1
MRPAPSGTSDLWWWQLPYTQVYSDCARNHPSSSPVDIYDPAVWYLLLLWMTLEIARFEVDWTRLERTWGRPAPVVAILLARLCKHIRGPVRIRRAKATITTALQ